MTPRASIVALALFVAATTLPASAATLDSFARCLTRTGTTFYGADWCPHCAAQIDELGAAFRHIDYVECSEQKAVCEAAGIRSYPTWTFGDGSRLNGRLSLRLLARTTGCPLTGTLGTPVIIEVPTRSGAAAVELPAASGVQIIDVP